MSKHTPGPFKRDPQDQKVVRCEGWPVLDFRSSPDEVVDQVVDLLNKGTHHDRLLEETKKMLAIYRGYLLEKGASAASVEFTTRDIQAIIDRADAWDD